MTDTLRRWSSFFSHQYQYGDTGLLRKGIADDTTRHYPNPYSSKKASGPRPQVDGTLSPKRQTSRRWEARARSGKDRRTPASPPLEDQSP